MRVAIVDDLKKDRLFLKECLLKYCEKKLIEVEPMFFENGNDFLKNTGTFDIIFLDIYMTGLNGIEVAEQLRNQNNNALIVFTTTSTSHAVKSFRVRAFDYLVKPYSYDQFVEVMDLCNKNISSASRYIEIKESRSMVKIIVKDIIYADYSNHYTIIQTADQVVKSYMPFADFEALLKQQKQFLVCNRNCLLNMEKVASLTDSDFVLEDGIHLPMSRQNRSELRQKYADFIFLKMNGED